MLDFVSRIRALIQRRVAAVALRSREWQMVPTAVRQKSFFSAMNSSANVLSGYKKMLRQWMAGATEEVITPSGEKVIAYTRTGQAEFISRARELLKREGIGVTMGGDDRITDPASASRLRLIYNTNIQQAQEFAAWQKRVGNPSYVNRFPAAQFLRRPGAETRRQRHVEADGAIRRWDDWDFWLRQNGSDIGGFQVPYGPWGFNSYMYQKPVSRTVAIRKKLVKPNETVTIKGGGEFDKTIGEVYKMGVKADPRELDPVIKEKTAERLRAVFGDDVIGKDGKWTLEGRERAKQELKRQILNKGK